MVRRMTVSSALDPSKGKDAKSGDYSAFIKLGRDVRGYLYCEADLQSNQLRTDWHAFS